MFDARRLARTIAFLATMSLISAACGGGSPATTAPTNAATATAVATKPPTFDEAAETKKLYDAAVAAGEKEVNFYGSINEEEAKPLLDIWAKAFPLIKNNYIRASESALVSRILTEAQAGKYVVDTLSTTSAHLLVPAGLALNYLPPNAQLVDPDYKDKDGAWIGIYANWNVIQVNTDKVKAGEIKTYEDIANPKWKGQVVVDDTDYEWYQGLIKVLGQQKADDLLKKIHSTVGVKVLDGHGTINDKVTAGEYAIALNNYLNQAERSKRLGGPTNWIAVEPVVVQLGKIVTAKNAPHPNAAKLLTNFLISTDAQKYLTGRGRITTRTDVPNDPPNLVTGLKKTSSPPLVDPELTALAKKFKELFK
ncbi:MAG TPA: ABC transporter substrate-binding protein [Candidatus Limnocylindria bacterium]|nr:ABC transporter substrate-binding protein [Candidatus Limnocylindria bacterium]